VNQSRVLGVEFDQASGRETFYDRERQALLSVTFNPDGLPQSWVPANGGQPVNITYDRCENSEIIYSVAVTVFKYMHFLLTHFRYIHQRYFWKIYSLLSHV
jgi:hypothetical protein